MSKGRFLIVEDEFVVAENLKSEIESIGFEVVGLASSGRKAMEMAGRDKPDLALMDIKLRGDMDGIETAIHLRQELNVPVLFLTAFADESFLERAKLAEPLGYLVKPYERKGLRAGIEMAYYKARMEGLLKESESRFRSMFENSPVPYLALDELDRCIDLNSELCDLLGYGREELTGRDFTELWSPGTRHLREERFVKLKDKGRFQSELELVRKDRSVIAVLLESRVQYDMDGRPARMHCILHDITERKRAEAERLELAQQLQEIQKAESLARMAGSIAHLFNNMLAVILGNLELAMLDLSKESDTYRWIGEAMKASGRAAEISHLMLTYLGQTGGKRVRTHLGETVESALHTVSIPANVRLTTDIPKRGPIIQSDAAHIRQILDNLVSNAREALGEQEGHITVSVEDIPAEEMRRWRFFPLDWRPKGKSYACLSVSDTGPGLNSETIQKIFDPFFTTRFTGRGLGLPVALGLIRIYDGGISVESTAGEGAVFRACFPITGQEPVPLDGEKAASPEIPVGKLVLVVDDEPMMLEMARSILALQMGCRVITAENGFEAVEAVRSRKNEIDLVLLDLSMPGMDGWQTLAAIRALRRNIPVILASGYDEAQVMQGTHEEKPQIFLHKPYKIADLKAAFLEASRNPPAANRGPESIELGRFLE